MVVLAEAVSIDGGALVALLAVMLAVLLSAVAGVVLGFVWAWRAGRGSMHALVGWVLVTALEVMAFFAAGLDVGNAALWLSLGAIAGQAVTYVASRARHPASSTTKGLEDDGRP